MSKARTLRIAAGTPLKPYSGVWRIIIDRGEVYLGVSKASMGIVKMSLHRSGVWVIAATKQSGATFGGGNRRAKQWKRPLEHIQGVTRGPSVLIPHTSRGARSLSASEMASNVLWYPAPRPGELVEFTLYFVREGGVFAPSAIHTVLSTMPVSETDVLYLVASQRPGSQPFLDTVERLLRENVCRMEDVNKFIQGSFLWVTQSADDLGTPLIVDLPVPVAGNA